MAEATHAIEVDVPVNVAYNQWTQFEDFPKFMKGVEHVHQRTDTLTAWKMDIGGKTIEFEAEITEQKPDERIAWDSVSGRDQGGEVRFERLGDDRSRVILRMRYATAGPLEKVADLVGIVDGRVKGDLDRFKEFIESRGRETGAWRGEVH